MKKTLSRLFAIVFFCLASLAIKSETTLCNISVNGLSKDSKAINPSFISEEYSAPLFPFKDLIIKI